MRKIILTTLLFLTAFLVAFAQQNPTLTVHYDYILKLVDPNQPYIKRSTLLVTPTESLYEIDSMGKNIEGGVSGGVTQEGRTFSIPSKENEFVYQNRATNEIYFREMISLEFFYIKETMERTLRWTIAEETKEILGYTCQRAVTEYGGRYYDAWFTTELPFATGPWRFHGLPGLILEMGATDGVFTMNATGISIQQVATEISNPYEDEETMNWNDFLALYQKKYEEVRRNNMKEWGPSQSLPERNIVIYIEE